MKIEGLIHWSDMLRDMQRREADGRYVAFDCWYAKKNGELKHYPHCRLSSIHYRGTTVNVLVGTDKQPKTLRKILFVRYNGQKVFV